MDPELKLYMEKYRSKIHKTKYIQKLLAAGRDLWQKIRAIGPDQAADLWPSIRANGPDSGYMALFHQTLSSFAINTTIDAGKRGLESSRLGFLSLHCGSIVFLLLFSRIFFFLNHVLGQTLIQKRKRDIDVIESDNL